MPFDLTTDDPALRRAILAETLRTRLPDGHTWNFGTYCERTECGTVGCAIGVAHLLWPEAGLVTFPVDDPNDGIVWDETAGEFFGLTETEVDEIFYPSQRYPGASFSGVTPAMVAAELEKVGR